MRSEDSQEKVAEPYDSTAEKNNCTLKWDMLP
jgi:hypothetical protein